MKLATFASHGGKQRLGIVDNVGMRIFDVAAAAHRAGRKKGAFASMISLIDAGPRALDHARFLHEQWLTEEELNVPLRDVRLLSPLPEPRQIRDFSVFPGHISGAFAAMQRLAAQLAGRSACVSGEPAPVPEIFVKQPVYYKCNRFSVIGHDHDVLWPRYSSYMDYELEIAAVIGRRGTDVTTAAAQEHIFGYLIFNDFSARDVQLDESRARMGPAKGKDFDTGNALGPWIVTADELGEPQDLRMTAKVNGELWSQGSSAGMLHSFEEMIAFVSRDETIHAGEILGSGTIGGGSGLEHGRFLRHGDVVELEVEGIGILRNRVLRQGDIRRVING